MRRFLPLVLVLALAGTSLASSMTPADNYRPLRYVADDEGTQTDFAVTWPVEADADIIVKTSLDGGASWQTEALNTDYTVTGEGTDSVEVVFNVARAESELVFIDRNDGIDRTTDFTTITPTGLNLHLDRQVMQLQQVEDFAARRCVRIKDTDDYNEGEGGPVKDVELPTMTSVDGHAVVANDESDAFVWSAKSLGDWDCLTCPSDGEDDGICDGGENDGDACVDDSDCPGGNCDNGTCDGGTNDGQSCDTDEECPGGQCDPGLCVGGENAGDPCETDADCPGGYCGGDGNDGFTDCDYIATDAAGVLVCGDGCPEGCDSGGGGCLDCSDVGTCNGGDNDGKPCNSADDCPGGECVPDPDDVCQGGDNDGDPCTDDADCPGGGRCTPNVDFCLGGANDGDPCTDDADCPGGVCIGPDDVCEGGANDGDPCQDDGDCPDGFCARCSVCFGSLSDGQPCDTDNADCGGGDGICISCDSGEVCIGGTGDGNPCTDDADCAGGGTCDTRDGVGVIGPANSEDRSVAIWNGTSGEFLTDSAVKITNGRTLQGVTQIAWNDAITGGSSFISLGISPADLTADAGASYVLPREKPYVVQVDAGLSAISPKLVMTVEGATTSSLAARNYMAWTPLTYPIHAFQPGVSTNNQLVARIYITEDVTCPDNFAGSEVWNATAFTASKTYNIQKNGSTVGTAVFDTDAGPNEATLATSGAEVVFAAGDYLDIDAPASADGTGGNLSFSLKCYRSFP